MKNKNSKNTIHNTLKIRQNISSLPSKCYVAGTLSTTMWLNLSRTSDVPVGIFSMGIGVIPIPVYVHSHSFPFQFSSWSLIPILMGFPFPLKIPFPWSSL